MEGWIKLHRKIKDNPIYTNSKIVHLLIELLFRANYKDKTMYSGRNKTTIKAGQAVFGYEEIAEQLDISKSTAYAYIKILEDEKIIENQSSNKGSIATILNWDKYQVDENKKETESKQKEPTKKDKKDKKERESTSASMEYLLTIPLEDISLLAKGLQVKDEEVISKGEDLYNYCKSKGKVYKDYRAFLRNALKRDFKAVTNSALKGFR